MVTSIFAKVLLVLNYDVYRVYKVSIFYCAWNWSKSNLLDVEAKHGDNTETIYDVINEM